MLPSEQAWVTASSQPLKTRFRKSERALSSIAKSFLYRQIEPDIRQCRVLRFPFGIIYRVRKDMIEIIAVMDLRRKPGYWTKRGENSPP
jgi:hypothetical protein